jgi:hypothetical protein
MRFNSEGVAGDGLLSSLPHVVFLCRIHRKMLRPLSCRDARLCAPATSIFNEVVLKTRYKFNAPVYDVLISKRPHAVWLDQHVGAKC